MGIRRRTRRSRGFVGMGILIVWGWTIGCSASRGAIPRVSMVAETDGFKMLRPQAEMRVCGGSFVAGAGRRGEDLLGEAIQRMLRLDPEADSIAHVQVEWTWRSIGLYDWRCVAVRGDLVREIRTILLPMPGAHEGH